MTSREFPKKKGEIKDITITKYKKREPARPFPTYTFRTGTSPLIIPLIAVVGLFIVMIIKALSQ